MNVKETRTAIQDGKFDPVLNRLYDTNETARYLNALDAFAALYGEDREVRLFSAPGRTEVCGNHTDHNHGRVLAAAVDLDVIAVASPRGDGKINVKSEGHNPDFVRLPAGEPVKEELSRSQALIRGIAARFEQKNLRLGGFDAYTTSRVLKGSGISSSAAFEVLIGEIFNALYNDGGISAPELAAVGQFAENRYFGKPCGLMDQTACAVGGFVAIDFADPTHAVIEPLSFDLAKAGYRLVIVNTGSSHSDLGDDYAAIPEEMKAAARILGQEVLRGLTAEELLKNAAAIREKLGDRALLRALHFVDENQRAFDQKENIRRGDIGAFLKTEIESGRSSAFLLQNIYSPKDTAAQSMTLALAVSERLLAGRGAWRVHGGGFAGTIQAFVPDDLTEAYTAAMDALFGEGASHIMRIRSEGAIEVKA